MTQGPYHLYSIGLLLILAYLASLGASRIRLLTLSEHRRFWNVLLLLFFSSTGILGLLLAIQVNYKLELSWAKTALQWHVDLGIGFAVVSIFHLTWHLGYYKKMVTGSGPPPSSSRWDPHLDLPLTKVRVLFLLLGFISMMAQLLLLREFIKTLHGNELVIGIFLALWMIMGAFGAWAGANYQIQIRISTLLNLITILSVAPLLIFFILLMVDRYLFLPGFEPGMIASITYISVLVALVGLPSGFLFAYLAKSIRLGGPVARYYMLESMGSLAGGVLFSLLLVYFLENLQVLVLLPFITALLMAFVFGHPGKRFHRGLLLSVSLVVLVAGMLPGIRVALEGFHFRNERILQSKDTPYGSLTFTSKEGQINGYLDRNPVLSSSEVAQSEEMVHYPALQREAPSSFLLIGGALAGNAKEVAKYKPLVFDYCEADPDIYRLGRKYLPSAGLEMMDFHPVDGRKWLSVNSEAKYDVVIASTGDPITLGWNRYYTVEFYRQIHRHLKPGGVFATQLNAGGNYINDPGGELIGINYQTLKTVFDNVLLVPGYATYFLASDSALSLDFPAMVAMRSLNTTYVNGDYLDADQLRFDTDQLMERIRLQTSHINSDLWPRLFFSGLSSLESRMGGHVLFITGILGVLVSLILLILYPARNVSMYISGFSGAGIQIVLIMVLQSYYGVAYLAAPIMITLAMAGIVAGSGSWKKLWINPSVTKITALQWALAMVAAILVVLLKQNSIFEHRIAGMVILGFLNFIPGLIVGMVYGMSVALSEKEMLRGMGIYYSADLAGAALGTFLPGLFMIPLIGVSNTFILFCGINVATGLYVLTRWR
jgi:spermidine synthase